jgi:hypothetical protein
MKHTPTSPRRVQTGGWPYLERALGWMAPLGLQAVIDLHGGGWLC